MIKKSKNKKLFFSTSTSSNYLETHDYLKINTTGSLIIDKTILPVCDHMVTGTQFVKCVKRLDLEKILGVVVSINPRLKYTPTRTLGQLVVAKVIDKSLRVLDLMLEDLSHDQLKDLDKTKYCVLSKRPSEEEQKRMLRKNLIEGETLMTVIDNSGAEYVRYIGTVSPINNMKEEQEEAIVEIITLNRKLDYSKRQFPRIQMGERYLVKLTSRERTFTRRDGSGDFTKIEFCAELIKLIE